MIQIRTSTPSPTSALPIQRLRAVVRGAVQGVGFRPFVFRLAAGLDLRGWVSNSPEGVFIEVEGPAAALREFAQRLPREKPPLASIHSLETTWLDPVGCAGFEIRKSEEKGAKTALVLPDIAICPDCLREILDPQDRRYHYPFTNCTNCGPRYSIIEALPYDRPNTTMRAFAMCGECRTEYENPRNRRFHAQPNACPVCGPHLELWDPAGGVFASHDDALKAAAEALRNGAIAAVKGLGGFHLIADARNDDAVRRLRARKHREERPLALMVPSLEAARELCLLSPEEEQLLTSPEAPIVLLRRRDTIPVPIAPSVAPANPCFGLMLPYTPLHVLLLRDLGFPVVATSGNLSDEPICTDEREALDRLRGIADLFLVHNRPIARHVDDSVVRVILGRKMLLRRARGYAPLPIGSVYDSQDEPALAVGGHQKNTVALAVGGHILGSQHIGDLETPQALDAFERVIQSLETLYAAKPSLIACDVHPDYLSTRYASRRGLPVLPVQHHVAHVLSCMAENELAPPVCGFSWDGSGYGLDGTLWGGEVFVIGTASVHRVARLRRFRLPGGERAIKEPRRSAIGLLFELYGKSVFDREELLSRGGFTSQEVEVLKTQLERQVNAPLASSVGRLFDAVASLVGLRQRVGFEGQAAMELEFATHGTDTTAAYPFRLSDEAREPMLIDWGPMVEQLVGEVWSGEPVSQIAARFHNTLAEIIVATAKRVGEKRVALSGGCFQNVYLTERAVTRLREEGFVPYWHQRVPPNDGGLALGQIAAARRREWTAPKCA